MIQPGQIDYQQQLDSLKDLPVNAQSIEYLTGLSRNPGSPFVRFLVESRLEQLTKALQNQAGSQAQQAQEASPQGTISDKIQQAAGLAALQAGQQRQAAQQMQSQASQAQMPVPEGIAQPQVQPEADYGGVASAPVDSEMFNFAPGGIVAFANPEKEKKQLVKDEEEERLRKQTEMYVAGAQEAAKQRAIDTANAPPKEVPTEDAAMGMSTGPAKVNPLSRMLLDPLKAAASGISSLVSRPTPQTMMLDKGEAPAAAPMTAPAVAPANRPAVSEAQATMLAGPQAAVPPSAPPPPPPPVKNTGIATGKPPAPPAPGGPPTGIQATLAAMQNMPQQVAFNKAIEDARKSTEGTTREQKIADELALQKALGVGTFEQQQMKMLEENKARKEKTDAGRGQRDFFAQLATYSKPGANWSQVMERDIASKSAALLEDEQFANSQNKLLTDIQRTAEERRVGTANSIRAAEATEKKTKQEMLTFIMKEMGVNMQVAQKILGDTLNAQVQMRGQDFQRQVGMANVDAKLEIASVKADMAAQKLAATLAGADTANKIKLSNSDPYKKLEARIAGLDQAIKYNSNPDGTPKDVEKVGKLKTDLADLRTQQATLAANILGGGGIGTLPQSTSTTGTKVIDFSKIK
jgi:hypothetical protein